MLLPLLAAAGVAVAAVVAAGADTLAEAAEVVATPEVAVAPAVAVADTAGADSVATAGAVISAMAVAGSLPEATVILAQEGTVAAGSLLEVAVISLQEAMKAVGSPAEVTVTSPWRAILVAASGHAGVAVSVDTLPTAAFHTASSAMIPGHAVLLPGLLHFALPNSRRPGSLPATGPSQLQQVRILSGRIPGRRICPAINPHR